MVAASDVLRFSPIDRPRIAISSDGTLAAIAEATRVVVLELPGVEPFAEVGVDSEATANDIAWVTAGAMPRLLVLSRHAAHSVVYLIDPHGPRTIAEIRLETPMRLFATVRAHALAIGPRGAAVLTATNTHLTPFQFPARTMPVSAGAAGSNFIVALPGSIEEWDPASRMPKRRLRLPRPAQIVALGGSDRVVWMTTQQEPARLDVIPLVNRGQPKAHDLPEPIAQATSHPRSDLVVCVGAETGNVYVIDLDGRSRMRTLVADQIDRADAAGLVVGRTVSALIAQAHRPVQIVTLDEREGEAETPTPGVVPAATPVEPAKRSTLVDDDDADDVPITVLPPGTAAPMHGATPTPGPATTPPADDPSAAPPAPSLFRPPSAVQASVARPAVAVTVPTSTTAQNLAERFSLWRDRMRSAQPRTAPAATPWVEARPSWRDEVVTWTRAVIAGSVDRNAPPAPPIETLAQRFDLAAPIIPAIVMLYGAHLAGERGMAPVEIARVLGRRWDEALGRGQLAQLGIAEFTDSRVRLSRVLQRVLDELPVACGTLVGEPGPVSLLGPCVVVAREDAPLALIAARCLGSLGGAILAAVPDADPSELFIEARAVGAAPMLRVAADEIVELGTDPAILVVSDPTIADQLGVPRLG